jgi:hypothetical protein
MSTDDNTFCRMARITTYIMELQNWIIVRYVSTILRHFPFAFSEQPPVCSSPG